MIFRPETVFTAKNFHSEGGGVTICADGRQEKSLKEGDVVKISRSKKRVELISFHEKSNQEIFFRKF
jgi:NAD kinase